MSIDELITILNKVEDKTQEVLMENVCTYVSLGYVKRNKYYKGVILTSDPTIDTLYKATEELLS